MKLQVPYADDHIAASKAFRQLTPDQMRQRMREAGIGQLPVWQRTLAAGRLQVWLAGTYPFRQCDLA